ncbi:MAG: hypothetical protein COB96_06350 [Planctomycetota bacterium]|nr:MAG: hypothetical protein COB96_06350 [Planctomycetota bacterium]
MKKVLGAHPEQVLWVLLKQEVILFLNQLKHLILVHLLKNLEIFSFLKVHCGLEMNARFLFLEELLTFKIKNFHLEKEVKQLFQQILEDF